MPAVRRKLPCTSLHPFNEPTGEFIMKSKIIALALFIMTAATVLFYPALQNVSATTAQVTPPPVEPLSNERPKIEVVFVLDTTGSMGGLIQAAKEKIWSIATTMASAQPAPEIKMGLVAYRDRGDAYVTRVVDLSSDLDSVYATLMDFKAQGGGDGPESVNQALHDAVHKISWSQDSQAYKVVFLVGDAPPHMDYPNDVKYPETLKAALGKGLVVNSIQCGQDISTHREWQQVAQLGNGRYFQVEQGGSAIAIATPYDEKLAKLSAELDKTRLYYGSREEKEAKKKKLEAAEKLHAGSSVASRARRAEFNASESGAENFIGDKELVDDVAAGRVDLSAIPQAELPEPIQAMAPKEQKAAIAGMAEHRRELQRQIGELARQRGDYLKEKVEAEGADADESLDHKIFGAVREQAEGKGLHYEEGAMKY